MLNKLFTFEFIVTALLATQSASAVQSESVFSDKTLQFILTDLKLQEFRESTLKVNQTKSVRKKRLTSNLTSKSSVKEKFASNCLEWSAHEIDRKAKLFEKAINDNSRQYRVNKDLVKAIITVESCFRVKAKSHAGAQGLMQLIPATARRFGVSKSYNPQQNIRGGVKYLKFLKARYKGNLKKVLAAYNTGEGVVDKYKGIPPYKETKAYVKNVTMIYTRLNPKAGRVSAVYNVSRKGQKPGRYGWEYNRDLAPHLYKSQ